MWGKCEGKVGMLKKAPRPEGLWGNRSTILYIFSQNIMQLGIQPRPFCPLRNISLYPLDRRLGESQVWFGNLRDRKICRPVRHVVRTLLRVPSPPVYNEISFRYLYRFQDLFLFIRVNVCSQLQSRWMQLLEHLRCKTPQTAVFCLTEPSEEFDKLYGNEVLF